MPLGTEVGLVPGDIVLDGDKPLLSKKGVEPPPQFSSHVYDGQMVGCIKMPLGTEVGFDLSHVMLDGYPGPLPQKGGRAPK